MPYVRTAKVLAHLSSNDKGITWCRQVTPAVKAEMGQILKDMQDKRRATAKRSYDAAAATTGLASAAAAVAASKSAHFSLSSGPDVGASGLAAAFKWSGEIVMVPRPLLPWPTGVCSIGLISSKSYRARVQKSRHRNYARNCDTAIEIIRSFRNYGRYPLHPTATSRQASIVATEPASEPSHYFSLPP